MSLGYTRLDKLFPNLKFCTFATNPVASNVKSYENHTCCGDPVTFIEIKKQVSWHINLLIRYILSKLWLTQTILN